MSVVIRCNAHNKEGCSVCAPMTEDCGSLAHGTYYPCAAGCAPYAKGGDVWYPIHEEQQTFREGAKTLLQDSATYEPASTGGVKGKKLARYDLIPVGPLRQLAELYGKGAEKYAVRNWEKGYDWSLSYAALQRHANAFWGGEDLDPENGMPHLTAVIFHAMALLEYGTTHPEFDDRVKEAA